MKHFAILITGMLLACSPDATSPNPYPNEINGLKFYEQYLNPLTPRESRYRSSGASSWLRPGFGAEGLENTCSVFLCGLPDVLARTSRRLL